MQLSHLFNFEPGSLLMAQAYMLINTLSNVEDMFAVEQGSLILVLAGPFTTMNRGFSFESDNVVYLYLVNGRLAWDTADHWRGRQVVP